MWSKLLEIRETSLYRKRKCEECRCIFIEEKESCRRIVEKESLEKNFMVVRTG